MNWNSKEDDWPDCGRCAEEAGLDIRLPNLCPQHEREEKEDGLDLMSEWEDD